MKNETPYHVIEAKAKRLALEWINGNRPDKIPLRQVSRPWWAQYGKAWTEIAHDHFNGTENPRIKPEGF